MAYTLTYSRSPISEGEAVVISLNGTGLPNGTLVPFTITGANVSLFDFTGLSSLSGNFLIQNDKSKVTLDVANDLSTEGNESFILRLTGPGRSESIGITITDTSQANVITPEFYITPDKEKISEGQTVVFNVRGVNVPIGTQVEYALTGIQNADVYNVPVTGNLIFAANSTYDTKANIQLSLLEDDEIEGTENIVMLLYPSFPYTLVVNGTTEVYDTTTTASKKLVVTADKNVVVEGNEITFTVSATNVNAGSNLFYRITPWTSWDIPNDLFPATDLNANDFIGLSSLDGSFPPLYETEANAKTNVTSVTFTTKDDFIFEPSEYFYLSVYSDEKFGTGSGIVEIRDSGNTYLKSFSSFSGNVIVSFLEPAVLSANVGGMVFKSGEWETSDGRISDNMVIQGKAPFSADSSDVFYQPFSYVIRSSKSMEDWMTSVKNVLHPAGFAIFSEINNETSPNNMNYAGVKATDDFDIETFSSLNVDSTTGSLNVSNTKIRYDTFEIPLTVDTVFTDSNPQ